MKFVLLFGPQAVGKMTVGYELEKQTGLKLFHNHMSIDLLQPYFGFTPEMWRIADLLRREVFTSYAKTEQYGMIFTYVWAFNLEEDWKFVREISQIFEAVHAEIYYVELTTTLEQRIARNKTTLRLEKKPTKRDVVSSEAELLRSIDKYRLNSNEGELTFANYLKIDNTHLSPEETAALIKSTFSL